MRVSFSLKNRTLPAGIMILALTSGFGFARELGPSVYAGEWGDPNASWEEANLYFQPWRTFFANDVHFFTARSEEGVWVYGAYYGFRYGFLEEWGFNFSVVEPDGTITFSRTPAPRPAIAPDRYSYSSPVASVEGNRDHLHFRLIGPETSLDLSFRALTPGFKPGNGRVCYTPDCATYLFSNAPAPLAEVSGVITRPGRTIRFRGLGFFSRGGDSLPFYRRNPISFSVYSYPTSAPGPERLAIHFVTYQTHESYGGFPAAWLLIVQDHRLVFATKDFAVEPNDYRADPLTGFRFPHRFRLRAKGTGVELEAQVQAEQVVELLDILAELPAPFRVIAIRFFRRPVYWTATSRLTGRLLLGQTSYSLDIPSLMSANYVQ